MMKVLWSIPLLLVLLANTVFPAPVNVKRAVPNADELIAKMNHARRTVAYEHQIANMHELSYDYGLESKAESMAHDCNAVQPGPNYIILPSTNNDNLNNLAGLAGSYPLQTSLGCAQMQVECVEQGLTLIGICLMGPHNEHTATAELIKKGPPGSHCAHGETNGLCIAFQPGSGDKTEEPVAIGSESAPMESEATPRSFNVQQIETLKSEKLNDDVASSSHNSTQIHLILCSLIYVISMIF